MKTITKSYNEKCNNNNEKCTNKGHNAFIEFKEIEDTLFQKKILRHATRGIEFKSSSFF